jgi:hypothetical protein
VVFLASGAWCAHAAGFALIALLEIYRRAPQAWTRTQIDLARVMANHIAPSLVRVTMAAGAPRSARRVSGQPARR